MSGAVRWEIRVIRRKSDYLNPSLQKVQCSPAGKTSVTGAGPCGGMIDERAVILRGAGAMSCQDIQGDGKDA